MYNVYEFQEPEELKKRPGLIMRFLSWLFAAMAMLVLIGVAGTYYVQDQMTEVGVRSGEARYFKVERGKGLASIAAALQKDGFIKSAKMFRLGAMITGRQRSLQAGEYRIEPGDSIESILEKMSKGDVARMSITIPEGFTSWQVVERLKAIPYLTGDIAVMPPEGVLFPNTYEFRRGDSRRSVLARMNESFAVAVREIWANRAPDLPLKSPQEMVILASMVEKETGVAKERDVVASVFINRLRRGMRLQSDPTIIYGITFGKGKLEGGIKRSHKDEKTDYNTYQIDGLPPGPIANPGIASLKAVASPAQTDYLYFVADGTGGHAFSKTYKEHQVKVAQWRKIEQKLRSAAQAELVEKVRVEQDGQEARAAATRRLYIALRELGL